VLRNNCHWASAPFVGVLGSCRGPLCRWQWCGNVLGAVEPRPPHRGLPGANLRNTKKLGPTEVGYPLRSIQQLETKDVVNRDERTCVRVRVSDPSRLMPLNRWSATCSMDTSGRAFRSWSKTGASLRIVGSGRFIVRGDRVQSNSPRLFFRRWARRIRPGKRRCHDY
jgi:hypothetical protein